MSIPTLPEDVLEIIFDFVHDKNYAPTPESQSTFASLALVSKTFLHLARTRLYYRPVNDSATRSTALLRTLQISSQLGEAVRVLASDPFEWELFLDRFLRLTPNLSTLILLFFLPPDVSKVAQALGGPLTIKELKIALHWPSGPGQHSLVAKIISLPQLSSIEKLELTLGDSPSSMRLIGMVGPLHQAKTEPFIFPPFLQSLILRVPSNALDDLLPTLANQGSLRNFELIGATLSSSQLLRLLNSLPQELASFSIGTGLRDKRINNSSYREDSDLPALPLNSFRSLPCLTSLTLAQSQGPSLEFLHVLASSCSHLVKINFIGSLWISVRPIALSVSDKDHFDTVFPQAAITLALLSFKNLRYVHSGYLRHPDEPDSYRMLKDSLESRRIFVEWNLVDRTSLIFGNGWTLALSRNR
ncbi:hypothetical protein JCM5353_009026 [Sporobolomyces roseus]